MINKKAVVGKVSSSRQSVSRGPKVLTSKSLDPRLLHAGMTVWKAIFLLLFAMLLAVPATAAPNLCQAAPTGLPPLPSTVTLPTLPQTCYQPPFPTTTSTVNVSNAADLQTALTNAVCGEQIVVQAGVTYIGAFTVPNLSCPADNPVLVVSSALSSLPPYTIPPQSLAGGPNVPTIECNNPYGCWTLTIGMKASGWYFAGLEFTAGPQAAGVGLIIANDMYYSFSPPGSGPPQYITFDRVLVHPNSSVGGNCQTGGSSCVSDGMNITAAYYTVMFSDIWNIVNTGVDSAAIAAFGPGPALIAGNYLESSGINLYFNQDCTSLLSSSPVTIYANFNGQYGTVQACQPVHDVTIRLNHFHKQAAWMSVPGVPYQYDVKNELEFKDSAQRMLVDSNWFDTTFAEGQHEFFVANCGSLIYAPDHWCNDVTFTNNLFEHGPEVAIILGSETNVWTPNTAYTPIVTLQGESVYASLLDPSGHLQQVIQAGTSGATMPAWNDTGGTTTDGTVVWQDEGPSPAGMRFMFRNNLAVDINGNTWGATASGWAFQSMFNGDLIVDHNTFINTPGVPYGYGIGWTADPPAADINLYMTNNFIFGEPFAGGMSPGPTIAGIPNSTFGGDAFVGDWWPNYNPASVLTPAYPPGITTVVSSTGGCAYNFYSVAQCWQPDWDLVGMTDFAGANAGTEGNLAGAQLAASSPFHNAGTDGLDIGANIPALLAALNPVFTPATIQPPTNLSVVVH